MWDMEATAPKKLKLGKGITLRVDAQFREKIDDLAADTQRDLSDILRDGLMAFWPEIEALNRQLGHRANSDDVARLRAWMDSGREADALGIDLPELIRREKTARAVVRAQAA